MWQEEIILNPEKILLNFSVAITYYGLYREVE